MNTDSAIIARSIDDPSAFGEVFVRHAPRIHRFVASRVGQAIADDIISETFLIAFERRTKYDQTFPNCAPWLFGIATNLVSRHRVQEARTYKIMERVIGREETEEDHFLTMAQIDAQMEVVRLAGALGQLKPRDRDVLLLFAWEDLTYEQIAAALGIPVGTVRSRLNRARRIIRTNSVAKEISNDRVRAPQDVKRPCH